MGAGGQAGRHEGGVAQSNSGDQMGGGQMKAKLITIVVGVFIAVISWLPLWIVEERDPQAMPVGLGLLTFAVSFIGGVVALVALVRLVTQGLRASKTPS
jgi:hypothetical protein